MRLADRGALGNDDRVEVEIEGRRLSLSNLDRVLWPDAGLRKRDMIDYYLRAASALLPHIRDRPLTLGRFPSGVHERGWYQSNCRGPEWLPTHTIVGKQHQTMRLCVVSDVPSLVWVANQGTVELHPFLADRHWPDEPTVVAFDLDPGHGAEVAQSCRVALWLREMLDALGLASFPKTSGSLGLHVYVPLNTPARFEETKAFARELANRLVAERPHAVVATQRRPLRRGKVLVDWLQNDPTRSTVAPYSLRGMPWPTVSTPVTWGEIEHALHDRSAGQLTFLANDALGRLERFGDLFRPVLEVEQRLPSGPRR